ncbi:protein translocase SecDF, variant type [Spiroplasma chinense]|nr:protein translocase SecDF, variant type [Spiroplasma chinense]
MNNRKKLKFKKKLAFSIMTIFIILSSLIVGIFFSTQHFSENYKLGSDFKGYYSALVAVDNANEETNNDGQPNGNAKTAAKVLEQRLNPMGTNQILIETAGLNYLKVLSPVDAYDSETTFQNQIQRNGGAILLDSEFADLQFSGSERKGINDYFTSASATSVATSGGKNPAISFELNGTEFSSLISSEDSNGAQTSPQMSIMIDADGLYNDVRNWYLLVDKDTEAERIESYYDTIISPLVSKYNNSSTEAAVKNVLNDMFTGRYESRSTGANTFYSYINLLTMSADRSTWIANFTDYVSKGFEYLSSTSKYVYDPNAKTEDFAEGGKYADDIFGYNGTALATVNLGNIKDVFSNVNKTMLNSIFITDSITNQLNVNATIENDSKFMTNKFKSYFLLLNSAVSSQKTQGSAAYINGDKFFIEFATQPESRARVGAAVFNASTQGYIFTVNSVSTLNPTINSVMLSTALIFMGIVLLALIVYVLFMYRLLGLFMIIVMLAISMLTLMSTTWFGLTLGPEAIIGTIIIVAINLELFSMIFENLKFNLYAKQRNIKTSFNISMKENIALSIDVLIALIVPAICLFWITSNAIQSFSIIILMGVLFSITIGVLVGFILNKLTISTNVFNNRSWLVALNTDFANQGNPLLNFKIRNLKNKIEKLEKKAEAKDKILSLKEQLKLLNEKLEIINKKIEENPSKVANKAKNKTLAKIAKVEKKIAKVEATKKQVKIEKKAEVKDKILPLKEKLKKLNEKLEIRNKRADEKFAKATSKSKEKILAKIAKVEKKIAKLDATKKQVKIVKLELKIADYNYILGDNTQQIIENESEIVLSTQDKVKVKAYEKTIKNGSKIMAVVLMAITIVAATIGAVFGPKYDSSFGNRTEYTLWGTKIEKMYSGIENSVEDPKVDADFRALVAKEVIISNDDTDFNMNRAVANYFSLLLDRPEVVNQIIGPVTNIEYKAHKFTVSFGNNFSFSNSSTNNDESEIGWINLSVMTTSGFQSRAIKSIFNRIGNIAISDTGAGGDFNNQNEGFISKRIRTYSLRILVIQSAYALLAIVLALIVYILIRFKWTYYIAMVVGIALAPAVTLAIAVGLQFPIGVNTLIALAAIMIFMCISLFMVFGKARALISTKDEKSMMNFFKEEIQYSFVIKDEKKKIKDKLFLDKSDLKLKLKNKELTKEEVKALKVEFRKLKHAEWTKFRDVKKENKIKINRVSKQNNYLKEVMVQTFKYGAIRTIMSSILYVTVSILLAVTLTPIATFGVSIAIGVVLTNFIILFICLPVWIYLEQIRIRNYLTRKRFINNLKVSGEEQIIEGVND